VAVVYVDRDSVQLLAVRVDYVNEDTGATDPTAYTVTVAVVPTGVRPVSGDFKSAEWADRSTDGYKAKLLVGASSSVGALTGGSSYDVYVKVAASPETWIGKSPDTLTVR
jgi:hypothetical protein